MNTSDEEKKESTRQGASKYAKQRGQPSSDIREPRTLEEDRRAGGTSDEDKEESARREVSRYAKQYS